MNVKISRFPDGEIDIEILEDVRGHDLFLIQSLSSPIHDHLIELFLLLDALRLGGAKSITAVIPYFGYGRQDHVEREGTPLSSDLMSKLITCAGADRILTVDLHGDLGQSYFHKNGDNLFTTPLFSGHVGEQYCQMNDVIIVSPDLGGVNRARRLAESLGTKWAVIKKCREGKGASHIISGAQNISSKKCILVDDIVDTAYTLCNAAELVMKAGAVSVTAYVTHAVLSDGALTRLRSSPLDRVFITDSILAKDGNVQSTWIERLSLSSLLAQAIMRVNESKSLKFA